MLTLLLAQAVAAAVVVTEPTPSAEPLTFPKAPRVTAGERPTSAQMIALANAFNARERSGPGNFHFRTSTYWEHFFLQMRNQDELGAMPRMGEFFFLYQLLDPENDVGTWPINGPGEPEGSNVASPIPAFIFGSEAANYPSEEGRISDPTFPLWLSNHPPATPEEKWLLGQAQRGAFDPETGNQASVAIEAARSAQYIAFNPRWPYAMGYGGWFAIPIELLTDCGATEDGGLNISSYEIKFTAFRSDVEIPENHGSVSSAGGVPVITYAGSCPYWSDNATAGHVQFVGQFGDFYVVVVFDGSAGFNVDLLPTADWLQGPYTGEGNCGDMMAGISRVRTLPL
jgi:hypothetical protein